MTRASAECQSLPEVGPLFEFKLKVEAPQLFLPTMTDSDNVKPGGLSETALAEKVVISFHHITDHIIQGRGGIRGALPDHETWLPHPWRHIGSRSCS